MKTIRYQNLKKQALAFSKTPLFFFKGDWWTLKHFYDVSFNHFRGKPFIYDTDQIKVAYDDTYTNFLELQPDSEQ